MASDTRWLRQRGTVAFRAGAYTDAEASRLQTATRNAYYATVYHMLGVIASQRRASECAIELFRRALALNPLYREAQLNLAIILARAVSGREMGDDTGATAAVARALELNPRYVEAHVTRGRLHQRTGQAAAAIAAWQRALAIDPGHKLARFYLAQATASRAAET